MAQVTTDQLVSIAAQIAAALIMEGFASLEGDRRPALVAKEALVTAQELAALLALL